MEHKFGVFKTVEELNRAACARKAEGDLEALISLAEENGLDREDAIDFYEGDLDCMATPFMAAIGKLNQEEKELQLESQLKDWKNYVVQLCEEYDGNTLSEAVFSSDRHLKNVLAAGLRAASKNRIKVNSGIVKAAGLPESASYIGMCGRDELRKIVLDYYLGENKNEGI